MPFSLRTTHRAMAAGAIVSAALTAAIPVSADEIELVSPIGDLAIIEPYDRPGMLDTYGATAPNPTWSIAQWSIPGGKLSPFGAVSPSVLQARAPEAEVTVVRGNGPETIGLKQDGALLPCLGNGQPRESDLFLGPNGDNLRNVRPGMTLARPKTPSLTAMTRLRMRVRTGASFARAQSDKGCVVNQAGSLIGVVLSNLAAKPPQTMFYQLILSRFCGGGPPERLKLCHARATGLQPYFTKNPFGANDHLPLAGQPYLSPGEIRVIDMDILPRLKLAIETGPGEIDRDPSHWVVGGIYLGQNIWGDVRAESSWSDFRLTAVTR